MTEMPKSHRARHHRRGSLKRFLLATGPFCFLALAFLLSAGVVEMVEQAPLGRPIPTLAEERAEAAAEVAITAANATEAPRPIASPSSTFLSDHRYDSASDSVGLPSVEAETIALGEGFGFEPQDPDDTLEPFGQSRSNPRYLGLR